MHQVEHVEQLGRHRHSAEHARAPLLEALEHDDPARQVDLPGRERQGFRNPTPGRVQHGTEGAHLARSLGSGGHKGAAFLLGVEKLHAGLGLLPGCLFESQTSPGIGPGAGDARRRRDTLLAIVYQTCRLYLFYL